MSCRRFWIAFLLVALAVPVAAQTAAELVAQGDALFQEVWRTQFLISVAPDLQAKLERAIGLYEQALVLDPNNAHALTMLSRLYYTLADVFLAERDKADAYARGQEYGERALRTNPEFVRVERERGFVEAVQMSTDIAALYWTYCNWARRIELGGAVGLLAAALRGDDRKLVALIERCLEIDRGFISGGPLRSLAAYWAEHPFRRNLELVRTLLAEAIASHPDYLENRLFLVEYYLIPVAEWARAREELQKVIDAPIGADALQNGHIKIRAVEILGEIRDR